MSMQGFEDIRKRMRKDLASLVRDVRNGVLEKDIDNFPRRLGGVTEKIFLLKDYLLDFYQEDHGLIFGRAVKSKERRDKCIAQQS